MTKFNWKPIAEVPEEYKDGRQVLCLAIHLYWTTDLEAQKIIGTTDERLVYCVMSWMQDRFEGYYDGSSPRPIYFSDVLDAEPRHGG